MNTRFVSAHACAPLRPLFQALDKSILEGISLSSRPRPEYPTWQELSVWRALDWGLVDVTWLVVQQNRVVERHMLDLTTEIDHILEHAKSEPIEVAVFRMVYSWTPYLVLS
jgi:hypothetical protein